MRLQAIGDVVITLPYLQCLKRSLPASVQLDFLTREETDGIPKGIVLFDNVFSIGGGRNFKKQVLSTCLLLPRLWARRYEVIIDLQNNDITEMVRRILRPKAWSIFDRFSPMAAGEKNRRAIGALGLGENQLSTGFVLSRPDRGREVLEAAGWKAESDRDLVILNPAAAYETRNWPIHSYVTFARLWSSRFPGAKFLVLGTSFIAAKAAYLKEHLGDALINLVGKTDTMDAFSVVQLASLVLSEDSGLMHMAWASGIPTVALFGSTRSDWARPLGDHSFFLDSSDLPCGNCMQATCRFGDVRCLTRFTPELVLGHAISLLERTGRPKIRVSRSADVTSSDG
jgi:heptosyltransferase-2